MKKKQMRIIAWALSACLLFNAGVEQNSIMTLAAEVASEPVASPVQTPSAVPTQETGGMMPEQTPENGQPTQTPEETKPTQIPEETKPTQEPTAGVPTQTPEEPVPSITPDGATPTESPEATLLPESTAALTQNGLMTLEEENYLTITPDENGKLKSTYVLSYPEDFLRLQAYCNENYREEFNGFQGITFQISTPPDGKGIWNLKAIDGFVGIGTDLHPFQGILECAIDYGVSIQIDKPLFASLGDGAEVRKLSVNCLEGCSAVIAEKIVAGAAVSVHGITVNGTIKNSNGNAGLIAALIENNATVTLGKITAENEEGMPITISGGRAGLLCGTIKEEASFAISDEQAVTVNAVISGAAAGGLFGQVTGSLSVDIDVLNQLSGTLAVQSESGGYGGGITGILDSGELSLNSDGEKILLGKVTSGPEITISGSGTNGGLVGFGDEGTSVSLSKPLEITGNISGQNAGGVFGKSQGCSYKVSGKGVTAISGNITANVGKAGGFAAIIGKSMQIENIRVTSQSISGKEAGGIVGSLQENANTKVLMNSITINADTLQGTSAVGGVVGEAGAGTALELAGTVSISKDPTGGTGGSIAGIQNEALIYLSEAGETGIENTQLELPSESALDEVGNYGGVFRNQIVESGKLIGDGTLANVGTVNKSVSVNASGDFELACAADFECLAIALNSQGNFGENAFDNAGVSALLGASYTVTGDVDISYLKTGIVTLNRNDSEAAEYAFAGSLWGSSNIVITKNIANRQSRLGLFSTITGDGSTTGTYQKLELTGEISLTSSAGGLAYQTIGSGLKLADFTTRVKLTDIETCGGVLALENGASAFSLTGTDISLAATIEAQEYTNYSGFITTMDNANVTLSKISLGGKISSMAAGQMVGGFLGRTWESTAGIISEVSVADGTEYSAGGTFGVFWGAVSNQTGGSRLTLKDIELAGLTVNASAAAGNCSLLIQNAQNLVLEVIDYDASECTVNTPGSNFDEIAGKTFTDGSKVSTGIVSLYNTKSSFPEYHYENKSDGLKDKSNSDTMYFYELFQRLEDAEGAIASDSQITDNIINSEEKLLLWDVVHYAAQGKVCDTFKKYYTAGNIPEFSNEKVILTGSLDASGISFYPVPNTSGITVNEANAEATGAAVTFGSKLADGTSMRSWKLPNHLSTSQHFRLQSGLLWYPKGNLEVSGLTLKGTCACLDKYDGIFASGALINGTAAGGSFHKITLQNLSLDGYGNAQNDGSGLLIGRITTGSGILEAPNTVSFEAVKMTGYTNTGVDGVKAAAALIGSAGSNTEKNLILSFRKMKIADEVDGKNSYNGDILKYASFLYDYTYTDDASINKGSGLYLYTEAQALIEKNVTYGSELDSTTEFEDNSDSVLTKLSITDAAANHFKPYVYQTKQIEINPKTGDILTGCGTYEDPYIIENVQQFLTLYRYINEPGDTVDEYQYKNFYKGWKVNRKQNRTTGTLSNDADFCDGQEESHVAKTFGESGFPTPLQMSQAYYELGADINLSGITSGTYSIIASDFVGFGTQERPFTGVWYGGNHKYTVILPTKQQTQAFSTYGFIQYAQGAVIKDLKIMLPATGTTAVSDSFGGVIADIKGGDNIIDNVQIAGEVISENGKSIRGSVRVETEATAAGGYVGTIEKGSLILRNVEANLLSGFQIEDREGIKLDSTNDSAYCQIGTLIGRVEDGYAVYEGSRNTTAPLWQGKVAGGSTSIEGASDFITGGAGSVSLCKNYNILNGDYLLAQTQEQDSKITVRSEDAANEGKPYKKLTIELPNSAAVQVFSMALNSGSLSVLPSADANADGGYTELSRCRKAEYSDMGNCTSQTMDYQKAVQYDNCMGATGADVAYACPYVYKYFGIEGADYKNYINGEGISDSYAVWNPCDLVGGQIYRTNWELTENGTYDLSVYADSFRGIGAIYHQGTNLMGSLFRGNFNGKGSTITYEIFRKALVSDNDSVKAMGLFNCLNVSCPKLEDAGHFSIQNLLLNGGATTADNYSTAYAAGGIAGSVQGGYLDIGNITVNAGYTIDIQKGTKQQLKGQVGAIVGITGGNTVLTLTNCCVQGTAQNHVSLLGTDSGGGLIGEQENTGTGSLSIVGCSINYLSLNTYYTGPKVNDPGGSAGGMVGFSESGSSLFINSSTCSNTEIEGYWQAGGLVGETRIDTTIQGVNTNTATISGVSVQAYKNVGGVIGEAYSSRTSSLINILVQNAVVNETNRGSEANGLGGVIGKNAHNLTLTNASVRGTGTGCTITALHDKTRDNGAGGIIGWNIGALTLNICTVDNVRVITDRAKLVETMYNAAGGVIGYTTANMKMSGAIRASNVTVTAPLTGSNKDNKETHIVAAGGFMGYAGGNVQSTEADDIYYSGLVIVNPTITGKQAGGAFGYIAKAVYLKGISISGTEAVSAENHAGSITSDEIAGGFAGKINSGTVALKQAAEETANSVTRLKIQARNSGGVAGDISSSGEVLFNGVSVTECNITGRVATDRETCVGGLIGTISISSGKFLRVYNGTVSNNTIAALTTEARLTDGGYSVGGALGRNINSSKGTAFWDTIQLTDNQMGIYQIAGVQQLVNSSRTLTAFPDMSSFEYNTLSYYKAAGKAATENGLYIGNFVGTERSISSQMYFIHSTVSYAEELTPIPVADVGRTAEQEYGSYRSNCHILYNNEIADLTTGEATATYMSERVLQAKQTITEAFTKNNYTKSYHLNETAVNLFGKTYQKEYEYASGKKMQMFVYKSENGTVQEVMNALTEVMTNGAGIPASGMNILNVSSKKKWIDSEGTVTEGNKKDCSILASKSGNTWNFTYQDYDGVKDGKMSYTELTFTYTWTDDISNDSTEHTQVYVLPIFAEEIITMGIYGNMKEGKILSVEEMKNTGVTNDLGTTNTIMMANDSDYTLFFEYVYGNARKAQGETVAIDKTLYLTQKNIAGKEEAKMLEPGTKLTLIDVTHGGIPYYYIVPAVVPEKIAYTAFKDSDGHDYQNGPICTLEDEGTQSGTDRLYTDMKGNLLKNVGVEQYLIFVEKPETYDTSTALYRICAEENIDKDSSMKSKVEVSNYVNLQITAVPGMKISFIYDSMKVDGSITKDDKVMEKIVFQLKGSELYWSLKRRGGAASIDSENHNKHLELGMYLRDSNKNRVYFPAGTNFRYVMGNEPIAETADMSEYQALSDVSVLYFYKEINNFYKIEDITADTTVYVKVEFSFGNAVLSELTDTKYTSYIDLLRTSNKDYPMGNNNKLDTYSHELNANSVQELGFAIMPDNYMDLGVNTYQSSEAEHKIPFSVKFDFSDILRNATDKEKDDAMDKWAACQYQVVYSFEEKTVGENGSISYQPYTGNALSLYFQDTTQFGEEASDTSEAPVEVMTCVYTITRDEIGSKTASRNMCLKAEPQEMDLSNYRLRATLTVMEPDAVPGDSLTDDFFVFTVTKLKTDL